METEKVNKTYGVRAGWNKGKPRWFVISDGTSTGLNYAHKEFALKKAEGFSRNCYCDFINFLGVQIRFTFTKINY